MLNQLPIHISNFFYTSYHFVIFHQHIFIFVAEHSKILRREKQESAEPESLSDNIKQKAQILYLSE
ncbi:hypothetical protein I7I53_02501 [Histoplasma capsulatum var. duboisii H88]|uniref:Uncharacterized protein n=1 Tax=Ajellomyces capsulatus (strain H88) TaxID=544711 RepID=A0A8A1LQF4_AJEC8|nr:hypothetical protein I7I53_02501 [Histoplasma capsulatum var. duboisii H88]